MKKSIKIIIISLVILIIGNLFLNIIKANPLPVFDPYQPEPLPETEIHTFSVFTWLFLWFFACLFLELLFGYIMYFRKNLRGVLGIFIANIISYPLFYFYYTFILYITENYKMSDYIFYLFIIIGEIAVIFLEAFILRAILKKAITFRKSLIISLILNLISLLGGIFIPTIWLMHPFSLPF